MTEEERQEKRSEAVSQIGKLVGACIRAELGRQDVMVILQTATSLMCEMNEVPIADYTSDLYKLHAERMRIESDRQHGR
jgi:hypothetical protein